MKMKYIIALICCIVFVLAGVVWIMFFNGEIKPERIESIIISIVTIIISITALVISLFYKEKSSERDIARYNLSAMFDFISKEYLDRKIRLKPIKISEKEETIDILRVAKKMIPESYVENESKWKELIDADSWESQVACETSIALERIGLSAFFGALSIRTLLHFIAGQIIEDYKLCHYWVKFHREKKIIKSKDGIDFNRRYGEWLAMLSVIWMDKYYPDYEHLSIVNRLQGGKHKLIEKFVKLTESEKDNLAPNTRQEILSLLKIKKIKDLLKT